MKTQIDIQLLYSVLDKSKSEKDDNLYVILDTARDECIFAKINEINNFDICQCLFEGQTAIECADAAPYLVILKHQDELMNWIIQNGFGHSWGIFLTSKFSFNEVTQHLKQLVLATVQNEEKVFFFRFYDPRVIRVYIPTCNNDELQLFFGPINSIYTESKETDSIIEFKYNNNLITNIIELKSKSKKIVK